MIPTLALLFILFCAPIGVFVAALLNLYLKLGRRQLNIITLLLTAPQTFSTIVFLLAEVTAFPDSEFVGIVLVFGFYAMAMGLVGLIIYVLGFLVGERRVSISGEIGTAVAVLLWYCIFAISKSYWP